MAPTSPEVEHLQPLTLLSPLPRHPSQTPQASQTPSRPTLRGRPVTVEIPPGPDSPPHVSPAYSPSPFSAHQPTPGSRHEDARHPYHGTERGKRQGGTKPSNRNMIVSFVLAQVFIVWIVVTAVVYLQDLALKIPGGFRGGESNSVGDDSLLGRRGRNFRPGCPLQPPVCRPEGIMEPEAVQGMGHHHGPNISQLPLVIFFAGIEGSGHKFFEQVFRRLPVNFTIVQFEPDLHLTAHENQTNVHPRNASNFEYCPKLPYARPLKEYAREMAHRLREAGEGPYVRARDSYPLGRVRTPLARPDLVSLLQLDGHLFHLKVVVLLRDLASTIRSASRMGYDGRDVGLQVRIVEDSMVFLDASIRMLPCSRYIVLDFEWVADEPEIAAPALARFLDLNIAEQDVIDAVHGAKMTKPVHNASLPQFGTALSLEEFFALRSDMWPLLAAARTTPYFWPQEPSDWPAQSSFVRNSSRRSVLYDYS